jgi:hypothetical protein
MRDKIEIVELGLDEEFIKQLEDEAKLSDDIKIKIKGHLDGLKQQNVNKKAIVSQKWEGKFDIIFNILKESYDKDSKGCVAKTIIMETISCTTDKEFSPTMQKFKNYLRTTKEDKWTLLKRKTKGVTGYSLAPFG